MLISKFDLYKTGWLELVFAKRNKEYGAYYLRQHYAGNVIKAMCITFFTVISAAAIVGVVIRTKPAILTEITEVPLLTYIPPTPPKAEPVKPKAVASKPAAPVRTIKFIPMVVTSKPVTIDPPKLIDMQTAAIGPVEINKQGIETGVTLDPGAGDGGAGTEGNTVENTKVYDFKGLDVMPTPYGGESGWTKFLQKNLKYPAQASEKEMGGKVWISFIIEKDGSLSNITLLRGPGFGMDDEALRVLKLAPAWKPGQQNGQAVRVKYTLPISFAIGQ